MHNTSMSLAVIAACFLLAGGLLAGSAQMRVNAGASWKDAPPDWGLHITTGDTEHGNSEIILNTNSDHWSVGLMAVGGSLVLLVGLGVASNLAGADEPLQ